MTRQQTLEKLEEAITLLEAVSLTQTDPTVEKLLTLAKSVKKYLKPITIEVEGGMVSRVYRKYPSFLEELKEEEDYKIEDLDMDEND